MLFRSYQPPQPLSNFIANFWLYEGYESPHFKERILPSGTFELVFNLRGEELRIYKAAQPNQCVRFSGAIISGPYNGFFLTDAEEEASVMGVHFKPGGAFAFLGAPAHELADRHVDLEAIWGRAAASEIRERLSVASSPMRRFRLLEELLLSRSSRPPERHGAVSLALETLAQAEVRTMTRELASQASLSEKRFIDVFSAHVGLTPKLFHRVLRFQRLLRPLQQCCAPDWAQLAQDYGYFDQSHLIRDFLAFSGLSPSDYLHRLHALRVQGMHVKFNHLPLSR